MNEPNGLPFPTALLRAPLEYHLEPEAEDRCCVYVFPANGLFLGRLDDLYIRRHLQPRRYGNIIKNLKPILIS